MGPKIVPPPILPDTLMNKGIEKIKAKGKLKVNMAPYIGQVLDQ